MSLEQDRYQVRFDWAAAGAAAIGSDADVIVWSDAIATSDEDVLAVVPEPAAVLVADIQTSVAAGAWIVRLQHRLARRITIAVIAAGDRREDGQLRFAVEDLIAAGAVIDSLAAAGLDGTSPEAAAAEGAYRHLGRAVAHLMTASVSASVLKPEASALRVNVDLGADDAVVLRQHAEG